jgi:hypothetical protein
VVAVDAGADAPSAATKVFEAGPAPPESGEAAALRKELEQTREALRAAREEAEEARLERDRAVEKLESLRARLREVGALSIDSR